MRVSSDASPIDRAECLSPVRGVKRPPPAARGHPTQERFPLARFPAAKNATLPARQLARGAAVITILIIVLLIILLGGGGYGYRRFGTRGAGSVLGLVLVIILILWLLGQL